MLFLIADNVYTKNKILRNVILRTCHIINMDRLHLGQTTYLLGKKKCTFGTRNRIRLNPKIIIGGFGPNDTMITLIIWHKYNSPMNISIRLVSIQTLFFFSFEHWKYIVKTECIIYTKKKTETSSFIWSTLKKEGWFWFRVWSERKQDKFGQHSHRISFYNISISHLWQNYSEKYSINW